MPKCPKCGRKFKEIVSKAKLGAQGIELQA